MLGCFNNGSNGTAISLRADRPILGGDSQDLWSAGIECKRARLVLGYATAALRGRRPANPIPAKALPNNQTAAGMGTGEEVMVNV